MGYMARCIRRVVHGFKYAKDSSFKKGLHRGEAGAEDPGVGFDSGPDGEVDEIICGGDVSGITVEERPDSRTAKVNRMFMDGYCI